MITAGTIVFLVLALIAIGTALGMLISRNSIYSVLFLVMNFGTIALLYLVLGAPFIALTQITVYAGAIMVLFLFVIMLLGGEGIPGHEPLRLQRPVSLLMVTILAGEALLVIGLRYAQANNFIPLEIPPATYATPTEIGLLLYSRYLLPFEVTSVILLAALLGAILLTRSDQPSNRKN
ncbi:MAG TPA: NADH-quinone oxidoreductase subunit J [Anaerolineaceae bacterium]